MSQYSLPFEIHVHGDIPLRPDVSTSQLQDALRPLWRYASADDLAEGAASLYQEEPGIAHDTTESMLRICWTVAGDQDFRAAIEDACSGLNELASEGAALEVSFYDTEFDEEEEHEDEQARDDFLMCFVGPTPQAILQVQRDMLVQDVVQTMERHFDASELGAVVYAIDDLFRQRYEALQHSMSWGRAAPRPRGGNSGGGGRGGRKPRHLH
jgi:hypothetical protein